LVRRKSPLPSRLDIVAESFSFICVFVWNRDTSKRPPQVSNPIGTLLLGYLESDGSGGENLDVGQLPDRVLLFVSHTRRGSLFRSSPGESLQVGGWEGHIYGPEGQT
jgi:hypothetical protein